LLYIDTSVLLPCTLTQAVEAARYRSTEKFFARISQGRLFAATSFYALHELYVFATLRFCPVSQQRPTIHHTQLVNSVPPSITPSIIFRVSSERYPISIRRIGFILRHHPISLSCDLRQTKEKAAVVLISRAFLNLEWVRTRSWPYLLPAAVNLPIAKAGLIARPGGNSLCSKVSFIETY